MSEDLITRLKALSEQIGDPAPLMPRATVLEAIAEIERLRIGHERYETARRMNPQQWAEAWRLNISTGKKFDEIVDNMRPFMRPNNR